MPTEPDDEYAELDNAIRQAMSERIKQWNKEAMQDLARTLRENSKPADEPIVVELKE